MLDLMNSMFDDFYKDFNNSFKMPTDIVDNDNEYVLAVDVPGVNKENIDISYENSYLTIKVTAKEEDEDIEYVRHEIRSCDASRSYYLENVDENNIKAKLENGVLYIVAGKKPIEKPEKKLIEIE